MGSLAESHTSSFDNFDLITLLLIPNLVHLLTLSTFTPFCLFQCHTILNYYARELSTLTSLGQTYSCPTLNICIRTVDWAVSHLHHHYRSLLDAHVTPFFSQQCSSHSSPDALILHLPMVPSFIHRVLLLLRYLLPSLLVDCFIMIPLSPTFCRHIPALVLPVPLLVLTCLHSRSLNLLDIFTEFPTFSFDNLFSFLKRIYTLHLI